MRRAIALLILVTAVLLGRAAGAQQSPPPPATTLPDFSVTALDGTATGSATLRQPEKWLLVYVEPASRSCDDMLEALRPDGDVPTDAELAMLRRTVLVVGGDADAARQLRDRFPYLVQAGWYADAEHTAFDRLELKGVPVALGLRADAIEWRLNGVPPDKRNLRAILRSW